MGFTALHPSYEDHGVAVAIAEMCIWGRRGARVRLPVGDSPAVALFGESPSRILCEVLPTAVGIFEQLAVSYRLPVATLGTTGGDRLAIDLAGEGATGAAEERGSRIADAIDVAVADLRHAWEHGLPRALGWERAGGVAHLADAALPGAEVAG